MAIKKTGAWLARYALEQIPVTHTFGIPGMQNTELYDEMNLSKKITPVLVTHEQCASFAADGLSRVSGNVGVLLIVPGAGLTNAMSGICEALLDGVPMIVIAGSARLDTGKHYQLHQIDQQRLVDGAVKKSYHIKKHSEIVPAIFDAYKTAISGCPGPVFIEIPVELQMLRGEVKDLPLFKHDIKPSPSSQNIADAVEIIKKSEHPCIFAGWGCRDASEQLVQFAEMLNAPVALTMQGFGVFPGTHPLHTGMSFGASAVPAAKNAFKTCDCLIAIGTRFAEVATGSYGVTVPENLIHIDIDRSVFDKNYKAKLKIEGDAKNTLQQLISTLEKTEYRKPENKSVINRIKKDKENYYKSWARRKFRGVNPALFARSLSDVMDPDDYVLTDVGNHTFLMAEHYTVRKAGHFIAPCDFNCMGYAVPASIGIKLTHPDRSVAAVIGDGCFLMTCMEIVNATAMKAGIIYCVFNDGELGQIAQAQRLPYRHKTCTVLPEYSLYGISVATGSAYYEIADDKAVIPTLNEARGVAATGHPVIINVLVDYSRKTSYTKGVISTNLARFPVDTRFRLIARAILRRIPFIKS